MPAIYEHTFTVDAKDIDELGHTSNVAYVRWMMDAATSHTEAQGWPGARYVEAGFGWVVRTHTIHYLRAAFEGDELIVRTWVSTMRKVSSERDYQIVRPKDGAVLLRARTDWAFVDLKRILPRRIPAEVAQAFEVVPERAF